MIEITKVKRAYAERLADKAIAESRSDRQITALADKLERSSDPKERLASICIRSKLVGDDEKSFKKACKVYTKTTSERLRFIA